jgi:hypothetical protein
MEGPAAGGMEVVPVVKQVQTLLFLMDSDPMELPFALEANKDSDEELGCGSRNEDEGSKSEDSGDGSFGAMDRDAMVE